MKLDQDASYGKPTKRIVFTETEHNHAQLILKLRQDSVSQASFFRGLIRAYMEGDSGIQRIVDEMSTLSKVRKKRTKKQSTAGKKLSQDLGFTEGDVEGLFDLIAEEHPDL
ncbi:MAG: hypothetical protein HOB02_08160 [Proteobacteria bacterium]|jgi:hypothetical protein|nr:hypothetical protein [Pseudomonadota bacterium]